jgi:hypothetical protein
MSFIVNRITTLFILATGGIAALDAAIATFPRSFLSKVLVSLEDPLPDDDPHVTYFRNMLKSRGLSHPENITFYLSDGDKIEAYGNRRDGVIKIPKTFVLPPSVHSNILA